MELLHGEVTGKLIDLFYRVYLVLGFGFLKGCIARRWSLKGKGQGWI
jgi:hypothetical protein